MVLDLTSLPPRYRDQVRALRDRLAARAEMDQRLAAAYDEAVPVHGSTNALTEVADRFKVTESRVRTAKWGK